MATPSVRKLHSVEAIGTRPAAAQPSWRSARPRARRGSLALRAVGSTSRRFPLEARRRTTRHSLHGLELMIKRHELLSLEDCLTSLDALEVILELILVETKFLVSSCDLASIRVEPPLGFAEVSGIRDDTRSQH
eukprot:CAMPEP_0169280514 /NCGR_PEP_ID=MMETSP1016-20121227/55659_1 /TAXON_ID=342587 /ORGANISM="Karlodinium micrum, Strain CCMP2283" /LENGTH=133 /DNA_ID=CAMNT_0009368867 /DNA_START=741 /DNA_END=1140 /DNA_ORIENTATION=+